MENAKKFFEEIAKTEEAKALFADIEKPEGEQECIAAYIEIARKLGAELTEDGIKAYFESISHVESGEIDDEERSQLVGGVDACSVTFKHGENCWLADGCDLRVNSYDGYMTQAEYNHHSVNTYNNKCGLQSYSAIPSDKLT